MLYKDQLKDRYKLLITYIGNILILVGVTMLLPLTSLLFYQEQFMVKYFLLSSLLTISIGLIMRLTPKVEKKYVTITLAESGVIVLVSWIITMFLSSLPFLLSGSMEFSQAIFEAVSGWTTTGLSVLDVESVPKMILLWRSIMQFFGGAGISIIMLSAIIGPFGIGMQAVGGRNEKILPTIAKSTEIFFKIYISIFIFGVIAYIVSGMPVFDSINHAMTSISTGGFSVREGSIGSYNSLAMELVTIFLMTVGAISFGAHFLLVKKKIKRFLQTDEVRIFVKFIALGILLLVFSPFSELYPSFNESLRHGGFQLISALSTSGFSSVDYTSWAPLPIFIMIIFMTIGGSVGSTAGGIKLYRIDLILKSLYFNVKNYLKPESLVETTSIYRVEGKQYVSKWHALEASNYLMMFLLTYLVGVIIFLAHGFPLKASMFEFASCLGTVGLSMGITSASAPISIIWTQIIGMILGRLEIFIIFFAIIKIIKDSKYIFRSNSE